jgi:hypothetical protein
VYLLDEQFDFPTDHEIDAFIAQARPSEFNWAHEIHDCDDIAFEFRVKAKTWFRTQKKNVAVATIATRATAFRKPHAFNFFIRKSDCRLIFIDGFERVPLVGRAYLVVM